MDAISQNFAIEYLKGLVGQPLLYALKSPDTELYDFGFGEPIEKVNRQGKQFEVGSHILHVLCRFEVICRKGMHRIDRYYEDTPLEEFQKGIQHLIGHKVTRIALSDKNDLWVEFDFGNYWAVFATFENKEESWRYFSADIKKPHLVASDTYLEFE